MAFLPSLQNPNGRIRVGGRVWAFAMIQQTAAGDAYLTANGITMKDPNLSRVNLMRRLLGMREIHAVFSNGLMSDNAANGHVLIDTGGYDSRFDYATQVLRYFKVGRSSAPATVAAEVELANDSSINAANVRKPVLVIGEEGGCSSDMESAG